MTIALANNLAAILWETSSQNYPPKLFWTLWSTEIADNKHLLLFWGWDKFWKEYVDGWHRFHYSLFIIPHSSTEDLRNQWNSFLIQQQIPDARKSVSCQVTFSVSSGLWSLALLSQSTTSFWVISLTSLQLYYTEVSYILHRYFWLPLTQIFLMA